MGLVVFDEIWTLAARDHNPYLAAAAKAGRPVMGYFCSYIPEEIIHAAGFVPYRMRAVGSRGTTRGDVYYSALNCTFVRHCFDKALNGDFAFLDGIIFMNGCDHTRRMYDNWRHAGIDPQFRHMFVAPHKIGETARRRYANEMLKLMDAIQKDFGVAITPEKLGESISLYNRRRALLGQIQTLRQRRDVPIRGSEMLALMLAISAMPVEDAIGLLERVLAALSDRCVSRESDLRIYVAAGCIEELDHLEMIENAGAVIVADNICLGQKHAGEPVGPGDPVQALSVRYLNQLSCPRMMNDQRGRLAHLHAVMRDYAIAAVVAEKLKFCDLWGGELFILRQEAKKIGFPILPLERELYGGGTGQLRTRLEAFFEQVRN